MRSRFPLARRAVHEADSADARNAAMDVLCALAARAALDELEGDLDEIRDAVAGLESEAALVLQAWHFRALAGTRREYEP